MLEETSAGNNREKQLCAISHGIGVLAEIQELEKVSFDAAGRAACPKRTVVIPTAASPCQLQRWVKDSFDDIFLNHCEGQPVYVDEVIVRVTLSVCEYVNCASTKWAQPFFPRTGV